MISGQKLANVPPEVSTLWAKAVASNCRAAKTALFRKWLQSGKEFGRTG